MTAQPRENPNPHMTESHDETRRQHEITPEDATGAEPPDPADETLLHPGAFEGSSNDASPSGYTQEALDLAVANLAAKRGMALDEEIDACRDAHDQSSDERTLGDLFVERRVLTPRQYERLCADVEAEQTGQRIPGYTMLAKIGSGASATVFKARQTSLNRVVAIKVLPHRYSNHTEFIERFYAEGRAAARLNHTGIVQAYDVGHADACHYFVMEYVRGRTVYERIQHEGVIEEHRALEITIELAEALAHAHQSGLIHRDVKPRNIIITDAGQAKLADLGLARAIADADQAEAEAGQTFGTPYYMSPEQARGDREIGPAADIYALGATFYHMLTGAPPFPGSSSTEVMKRHINDEPTPPHEKRPGITLGISELVLKMLAKETKQRYASCEELLDELRAWRSFHILKQGESER